MSLINIGLIGDFNPVVTAHIAIPKALRLSGDKLLCQVNPVWIPTDSINDETEFNNFDGLWSVPNTPYKKMAGALTAIRYARENYVPFLGTCGGFQHAVIEYFRNVLRINAGHAEIDPDADFPVISQLTCSLIEKEGEIFFKDSGFAKKLYGVNQAIETFHCNYGFNSLYIDLLKKSKMKISGEDKEGEVRIIELEGHPFFIATLFQPERSSLKGKTHPLINAFLSSIKNMKSS